GLKKHICSSAAAVKYPEYHFDAVRLGSALLGRIAVPNKPGLEKVGFMECEIISIKTLPAGHFVGYGEAYKTTRETSAAVVPLGVCDGYGLSKTEVAFTSGDKVNSLLRKVKRFNSDQTLSCVVCGKKAQVIGKVGLTDLVIDVTGIECKVGDVAAFEFNPTLVDALVKKDFV
ncbi:MAG: alanine racemase C-terminal domain-containing protein, partial [Acutalibacteraceae bacterium]|nr:alanine racemase C-terminal domain-containing protein [Acutalibacteraceae bacterium]